MSNQWHCEVKGRKGGKKDQWRDKENGRVEMDQIYNYKEYWVKDR